MSDHHWRLAKWASLAVSVGSLLVAVVLMWTNQKTEVVQTEQPTKNRPPQTKMDHPLIVERKGDRMIWRLQADSAKQQKKGMRMIKPVLELFTESGQAVPVRGQKAWFEPETRNIQFDGKVVVTYGEWTLHTEQLRYDSAKDEVVAPGAFHLFKPDVQLRGRGLQVDRQTQKLHVLHDVWAEDARPDGLGGAK